MKVALAQMDMKFDDIEENKKKVKDMILDAINHKARVIFFPEMTFTGFTMNQIVDDSIHTFMLDLSSDIAIGYGYIEEGYYNSFNIVDKNKTLCHYQKIHPFLKEAKYYKKGDTIVSATIDDLTFVPSICFDLRFPILYALMKEKGDVLVNIASWPKDRDAHWMLLLQARAIENQRYMIGVNRCGSDPYLDYKGHSVCYDGWGTLLNEVSEKEEVIYVDINKKEYPANFVECQRFDVYKKMINE